MSLYVTLKPGKWRAHIKSITLQNTQRGTQSVTLASDLDIYCGPHLICTLRMRSGVTIMNQLIIEVTTEEKFEVHANPTSSTFNEPTLSYSVIKYSIEVEMERVDN